MSDDKKYYYIKLKDNYFDQDNVKILESVTNGHIYSLIIVKLYLKATKYGGQLKMTGSIPYDPTKIDILAKVLHHDVSHVREALKLSNELGIITIQDSGAMWMTEIQNFIGLSSSEADRKRAYRKGISQSNFEKIRQISDKCPSQIALLGHLSDVRPPEIEIEIEIEKDIEKEIELKKEKTAVRVPLKDGTFFIPDISFIETLTSTYTNIDMNFELKKITAWCVSNPSKQKTLRGVKKFINGWMSRANTKAIASLNTQEKTMEYCEL